MSDEHTIMLKNDETVDVLSVSKTTSILPPLPMSEAIHIRKEEINFSVDDLSTLPPLDSQYTLSEVIGEGGQGVIHIASDKFLQRTVAVKSLKPEFLNDEQVMKNFVTEAKITSQLEHPAIIPLHAVNSGGDEKGLHIAMKMIRGRTLREILDETVLKCKANRHTKKIPKMTSDFLKNLIEDFVKVCDAVAFAHNKGVTHKDLKPANIMIGEFHEVYVMDWGIAQLYENADKKTDNGRKEKPLIDGTPGFIAPEVVVGGTHTPASDQYALGIILFEIATMSPAISGRSIKEIFEKTRDGRLEPLIHRFSQRALSKDLKAVVRKATAENPSRRYASVSDLASDLRRFLTDDELEARPDNFSRKISRWLVNHRNLAATLILSFLLVCSAIAIFALVKRNQAIRETKRRSLALASLQATVESRAHVIDKHYFHIAHLLSRFSWDAGECLSGQTRTPDHSLFLDYNLFTLTNPNRPPSLKPSKAYGAPISLSYGAVKAPSDTKIPEDTVKRFAKTLTPILLLTSKLLTYSDPDNFPSSAIEAEEHTRLYGYPVAWMYIGLSNGLMFNYPGCAKFPLSYDPRKRFWYKKATTTKKIAWSAPYKDAFGRGLVVTASKAIRKDNGYIYGVAGLDMTFDYITKVLMRTKKSNKSWNIGRYLVDKNGKVLISSSSKLLQTPSTDAEIEFPAFPYREIYSHLKKNDSGQFEVAKEDGTYLVVYAPVETMGWHFVEVVDLNKYLDSRRFLKKSPK